MFSPRRGTARNASFRLHVLSDRASRIWKQRVVGRRAGHFFDVTLSIRISLSIDMVWESCE